MSTEFLLALFVIAVGLSAAAVVTYLYQGLSGQPAMLRYDGPTFAHTLGHLFLSFICGPYIMLKLGWRPEANGRVEMGSAVLAALVAFGWSFVTGLFLLGTWFAMVRF
ncbi:hypothetical protein EMQ25_07970 [Arsenicitalea aurantiaca]|uniref:Uncharacterized protein n=1 Tax=Arsenicitalea aurantiaca TaxID=1783274 RepID=A0A433XG20_9HYPH|nr:hypothetical protein [Arsenicitalea aurantiaca]RUT33051.1 hypothetical protein EMQ25_07970 [Arsenicitalea aurantiaca]